MTTKHNGIKVSMSAPTTKEEFIERFGEAEWDRIVGKKLCREYRDRLIKAQEKARKRLGG